MKLNIRKKMCAAVMSFAMVGAVMAPDIRSCAEEMATSSDADEITTEAEEYVEETTECLSEDILNLEELSEEEEIVYASGYSTISSDEAYDKMIAMMDKYPTGTTWTNDNSYKWNCGWTAWGCMGFAHMISDAAFGNAGLRTLYKKDISGSWFDAIRVGDVVRIPSNHSVSVLRIYEDYVVVAEGNASGKVRWGRVISKDEINSYTEYIETRYAADTKTMSINPILEYYWWVVETGPRSCEMEIGEEYTFPVRINPADANAVVEWKSSDTSVAEVDQDGKVTTKKNGVTNITATYAGISSTCEVRVNLPYTSPTGIFFVKNDHTGYVAGITTNGISDKSFVEYSWYAVREGEDEEVCISDWQYGNEWLDWTPEIYGNYTLIGRIRVDGFEESLQEVKTEISYSPYIKGKCQMPYTGEGGGYLIGFETYDNPGQKYRYEMLILDCTLLAEGKPAWIYTTTQCGVAEGNALWTIWQPQYGYYWTLFRLYDENGNLIDQQCYGFQNI